jgi:hypothetical protein
MQKQKRGNNQQDDREGQDGQNPRESASPGRARIAVGPQVCHEGGSGCRMRTSSALAIASPRRRERVLCALAQRLRRLNAKTTSCRHHAGQQANVMIRAATAGKSTCHWQGRATHISRRSRAERRASVKVTQIAFPETTNNAVYATGVYASRGSNPTSNARDNIFADNLWRSWMH